MTNDEIKNEMKVVVDVDGVMKLAKVIDRRTERTGNGPAQTIGWGVQLEPNGLNHSTTADKIYPRGGIEEIEARAKNIQFTRVGQEYMVDKTKVMFTQGDHSIIIDADGKWHATLEDNASASGDDLTSLIAFLEDEGRGRVTRIIQQ